jgi:DNA polymerase-3 subunit delta
MPALGVPQFLDRVARGRLERVIVLEGEERYLRDLCRRKLVEKLVPEAARDWGVSRFSLRDASLDDILGRARTLPMLSPQQVVFVAELEAADRWGDERREAFVETLAAYLDDAPPFTTLVLEAEKLDRRMKLGKTLDARAQVVSVAPPADPRERQSLAETKAAEIAAELGIELAPGAAAELAEATAADLARIETELEKLRDYVGARRRVTVEDVERMVVAAHTETVWQLGAALAERDAARALALLDGALARGEELPMLVGGLAWMYRKLLEAQELPRTMNAGQVAGRLRMRYDTAELALRQAHRIPREQLLAGIAQLHEADNALKSNVADKRAVLEFVVARLASPPAA